LLEEIISLVINVKLNSSVHYSTLAKFIKSTESIGSIGPQTQ